MGEVRPGEVRPGGVREWLEVEVGCGCFWVGDGIPYHDVGLFLWCRMVFLHGNNGYKCTIYWNNKDIRGPSSKPVNLLFVC